jgi:hypothetical protein
MHAPHAPVNQIRSLLKFSSDGLFAEDVEGLVLQDVSVVFAKERQQWYWTMICFNMSETRWPVNMTGCSCSK